MSFEVTVPFNASAGCPEEAALAQQWKKHKQTIYDLYIVGRQSLKTVREFLQEQHFFIAR